MTLSIEELEKLEAVCGDLQVDQNHTPDYGEVFVSGAIKAQCMTMNPAELALILTASNTLLSMAKRSLELEAENEKLREIVQGAAKVNLIDAEDKDGKVIFSMSMEGEQLFNPPQFVRLAKAYVADRNLLKGGE